MHPRDYPRCTDGIELCGSCLHLGWGGSKVTSLQILSKKLLSKIPTSNVGSLC